MKATKEIYLKFRNTFLRLGYNEQVAKLDIHFKLNLLRDRGGKLIRIL